LTPLLELIDAEFGPGSCARDLIERATRQDAYDRLAARDLLRAARGGAGESWAERRLAVLLLENQLLRLAPSGLLRRLSRLRRAHDAIGLRPDDPVSWRYFFRVARDVSKLYLARFVFTPEETVAEVRRQLEIGRGAASLRDELPRRPLDAPAYENAIVDRLCDAGDLYWVSDRSGSELNALVEFPLTSAVVVVKPPGSEFEIEFKRAGVPTAPGST